MGPEIIGYAHIPERLQWLWLCLCSGAYPTKQQKKNTTDAKRHISVHNYLPSTLGDHQAAGSLRSAHQLDSRERCLLCSQLFQGPNT